jgi:Peptidase family M28
MAVQRMPGYLPGIRAAGQGVTAARDWIFKQFSKIEGLQVRLDPFVHANCPTAATFNVVAWLPGRRNPERLVVIGGHYDSRTINVLDAASPAPGANDSGSQTSLVLEAARTLSHQDYDATLVFVAFSGEEQGLFGSGSIAASLDKYFPGFKLIAMLNSDIVGGDNTVNGPAQLQQFRLYSPGTPRERRTAAPDGSTDNTSPARGVMRYVGTWRGRPVRHATSTWPAIPLPARPSPGPRPSPARSNITWWLRVRRAKTPIASGCGFRPRRRKGPRIAVCVSRVSLRYGRLRGACGRARRGGVRIGPRGSPPARACAERARAARASCEQAPARSAPSRASAAAASAALASRCGRSRESSSTASSWSLSTFAPRETSSRGSAGT